jgi:hypothetical protein
MTKLLVNAPTGQQEIIEIGEGGGYFDSTRVLWDERDDGPLPSITPNSMKRVGNELVVDSDLLAKELANQAAWDAGANDRKSTEVRAERNAKLTATDWTQVADSTADKAAWATYRQALRDITAQGGFPWTIDWPVQP